MAQITPEPAQGLAEIAAYSRRQAMDWSLVLASQGIEAVIERSPEGQRWLLRVPPEHLATAQNSIRLYRAENRGWNWRREFPDADLQLHWGAIVFCVLLTLMHSLASYQIPNMVAQGTVKPEFILKGEWWRQFTAVFLHSDLAHLMANVTFGILVLGLAMGRYGAGLALTATLFAGAAGNLLGLKIHEHPYTGLGASGMMMGALGMLTVQAIHLWRENPRAARVIISGVTAGVFLFVLFGTNPSSDVVAHAGGFIAGLVFGGILALAPAQFTRRPIVDRAALFFFVTFSALVWILAMR